MQNGQPNAQFIKEQRNAKEYYDLGKQVAKIEQDKKETEQGLALTMLQKAQAQEAAFQTQMMLTELKSMIGQAMGGGGMTPPGVGGMPAGNPMASGMPPDGVPPEGNIPPDGMPPEGMMPPPNAMGGGGAPPML